jgi:hypothetical protein
VLIEGEPVSAIEQIVDAYVRLGNRGALVDLLAHRERLLINLNGRAGFDLSLPLGQIKEEIAVILAGLEKLRSVVADSEARRAGQAEPPE